MIVVTQQAITDADDASVNKFFLSVYNGAIVIRDLDAEIEDGGNELVFKGSEIDDLIQFLSAHKPD
jgi:hypothetical protein